MNSKRLDPLIRRAESREDALAKELAKRVQAHQQQAQRLGDLERFRGEYEAPPVPGTAVSASQLLNRAAFLAKIDDAVVTQQKHIATSEEALAIERSLDGLDLCKAGRLWLGHGTQMVAEIGSSVRIGITRAVEQPWRFYERGNPHVSGPARLRR